MCKSRQGCSLGQDGAVWGRPCLALPTLLSLNFPNLHKCLSV